MDIWDWLDPWWAWWAGFTGLFDWTAIAAVFTAAAVGVALHSVGRTAAAERRKALALVDQCLGVFQGLAVFLETDEEGYLYDHMLRGVIETPSIEHGISRLSGIPINDWAETRVAMSVESLVQTLTETVAQAKLSLAHSKIDGRCPSFAWLADFDYDHREITEAKRALQYGMFKRFAPKPRFSFFNKPRTFSPDSLSY